MRDSIEKNKATNAEYLCIDFWGQCSKIYGIAIKGCYLQIMCIRGAGLLTPPDFALSHLHFFLSTKNYLKVGDVHLMTADVHYRKMTKRAGNKASTQAYRSVIRSHWRWQWLCLKISCFHVILLKSCSKVRSKHHKTFPPSKCLYKRASLKVIKNIYRRNCGPENERSLNKQPIPFTQCRKTSKMSPTLACAYYSS